MMKLLVFVFLWSVLGCETCLSGKVHIKGQLVDMGSQEVTIDYTGITGDFGTNRNIVLKTGPDGYFDTTFVLEAPAYFNISRNILYLTPGDDLEVYLTPDTRQAKFKGKGSEANIFLQDRLYPKGGSYLLSGRNIKGDFQLTKQCVDSLAAVKLTELEALKEVSAAFKKNERMRVKANLINSYLMYPVYNRELRGLAVEDARQWEKNFMLQVAPDINAMMKEIAHNEYLDITDVRDVIMYNLEQEVFLQGVEITPEMWEIKTAMRDMAMLDTSTEPEIIEGIEKTISQFKNRDIADELRDKISGMKSLMNGQPAHDIVMSDTTGREVRLSQFKGQNIYLDCWATWCGPCIQESPAFNRLKEEYQGKDIVFIQLSTDTSRKSWLSYVANKSSDVLQYNSTDNEGLRERWQIKYIPRFILIDKNFNIFRAFAPRPSDAEVKTCLQELLDN